MNHRLLLYGAGLVGVALVLAQFIRPDQSNPPSDPGASFVAVAKPSPEVANVIGRACRDCHSNQTVWPWYSRIAPASWLIARDVNEGRARLNFSQWTIYSPEMTSIKMGEICSKAKSGEMPPAYYVPLHPEARVTAAETAALCGSTAAARF